MQIDVPTTLEKIPGTLTVIERLLTNLQNQIALLRELRHVLVLRVGVRETVYTPRSQLLSSKRIPRCQECGAPLGLDQNEHAVLYEGKYWHVRACMKVPQ